MRLLTCEPENEFASILATARRSAGAARSHEAVMRDLRRMKADAALLIALADIGGVWPVPRVTRALTDAAETALHAVVHFLLARRHAAWPPQARRQKQA